jgi:hypothetical protein
MHNALARAITTMPFPAVPSGVAAMTGYLAVTNMAYLARRSHLRGLSKRQLLRIRTTREEGVSRSLYCTFLAVWQILVVTFPLVETVAWVKGLCCFFYSYPNAQGCGIILEPLNVQHLPMSKRTKSQIRFDWHRFKFNIGNVGRDGYRHGPALERNLPHLDMPSKGLKHWPWRRRFLTKEETQ